MYSVFPSLGAEKDVPYGAGVAWEASGGGARLQLNRTSASFQSCQPYQYLGQVIKPRSALARTLKSKGIRRVRLNILSKAAILTAAGKGRGRAPERRGGGGHGVPRRAALRGLPFCSAAGAASALPEAAGEEAAAVRDGGREAAAAQGARGEPGGQAEEDPAPCAARPTTARLPTATCVRTEPAPFLRTKRMASFQFSDIPLHVQAPYLCVRMCVWQMPERMSLVSISVHVGF